MISVATENAQILSEEVKRRVKIITSRDHTIVEQLDNVLDVLRIALGRSKPQIIREIQDEDRKEDEDIKDYVARVFRKVDKLSANIWYSSTTISSHTIIYVILFELNYFRVRIKS